MNVSITATECYEIEFNFRNRIRNQPQQFINQDQGLEDESAIAKDAKDFVRLVSMRERKEREAAQRTSNSFTIDEGLSGNLMTANVDDSSIVCYFS
jgi:hypothetical protein